MRHVEDRVLAQGEAGVDVAAVPDALSLAKVKLVVALELAAGGAGGLLDLVFVRAHACHVPSRRMLNAVAASFTGVSTAVARR